MSRGESGYWDHRSVVLAATTIKSRARIEAIETGTGLLLIPGASVVCCKTSLLFDDGEGKR